MDKIAYNNDPEYYLDPNDLDGIIVFINEESIFNSDHIFSFRIDLEDKNYIVISKKSGRWLFLRYDSDDTYINNITDTDPELEELISALEKETGILRVGNMDNFYKENI